MPTFDWPDVLVPQALVPARVQNFYVSGGPSLAGPDQRLFSDAGLLGMTYVDIVIRDRETEEAYRWAHALLQQGWSVNAPIFERYEAEGARAAGSSAQLSADALVRAATIEIETTGITIRRGNWLNIGNRLHLVTEIVNPPTFPGAGNVASGGDDWGDSYPWNDGGISTGNNVVKVLPPLRAARTAGTAVSFKNLTMLATIVRAEDGELELSAPGIGSATLPLREYF